MQFSIIPRALFLTCKYYVLRFFNNLKTFPNSLSFDQTQSNWNAEAQHKIDRSDSWCASVMLLTVNHDFTSAHWIAITWTKKNFKKSKELEYATVTSLLPPPLHCTLKETIWKQWASFQSRLSTWDDPHKE